MPSFQTLPGFRDFYPEDFAKRSHVFRCWKQAAVTFGFQEYDAPVLESLDLYKAKSGDEVEGQVFSFVDKGERPVALRPEMTPSVCRMVGAKAGALKRPIKWFSVGEFYRYERMQKGRGRCFSQLNADIFGETGVEAEIELIALLIQCFTTFGLTEKDFCVRLSDRNLWWFFLESLGFDSEQSRVLLGAVDRYEKSPDSAFDTFEEKFGPLGLAPREKILSFLSIRGFAALQVALEAASTPALTTRLAEWQKLLSGLTAMGLVNFIEVNLGVVRGLAYYTGFVFEAFDRRGELRALAGGGRYDDLVEKLGGPALPAVGFAIGDMTFSLLLEERGLMPTLVQVPDIYAVIGGPAERSVAFAAIGKLRASGYRVDYPLREVAFGKQFKLAADSGAKIALLYGDDEVKRGVVKIRNLVDRSEREIPGEAVLENVREMLSGKDGGRLGVE